MFGAHHDKTVPRHSSIIIHVTKYNSPFVADPWIQSDDYISSCLKQRLRFVNVVHFPPVSRGSVVCADNKSCRKIMCAGLETSASLWMFPSGGSLQAAGCAVLLLLLLFSGFYWIYRKRLAAK